MKVSTMGRVPSMMVMVLLVLLSAASFCSVSIIVVSVLVEQSEGIGLIADILNHKEVYYGTDSPDGF